MIDTLTMACQYIAKKSESWDTVLSQRHHCLGYADTIVANAETIAVVRGIVPVFVTPSASATYWAIVVTTQLSLAALDLSAISSYSVWSV